MIRLQWLDFLATLRERKTWLCCAMLVYAVISIPVILARPPAHVKDAIDLWFGSDDSFVVFMFVWIDLAMNKAIAFLPAIFASGIVLRERDQAILPLIASKPVSIPRYFIVRALSACAVMATLHLGTQLIGSIYFSWRIPGFRVSTFLGAMALHVCAAIFATALAAAIAGWVKHRGASALLGLFVLNGLVGLALIGFYQPRWRAITMANPITLGALSLRDLDHLRVSVVLPPMAALLLLSATAIGFGALGVRKMEA